MAQPLATKPYELDQGERAAPVALYTVDTMFLGQLIVKTTIMASTWLRTPGLADFVGLYEATEVRLRGAERQVRKSPAFFVPVPQIVAMHLLPPENDKPQFDPSELNRKFEPITASVGPFRFDATMRMPAALTLSRQLAVMREPFTMIYDAEPCPVIDEIGPMKTSIVMLRPQSFTFTTRS